MCRSPVNNLQVEQITKTPQHHGHTSIHLRVLRLYPFVPGNALGPAASLTFIQWFNKWLQSRARDCHAHPSFCINALPLCGRGSAIVIQATQATPCASYSGASHGCDAVFALTKISRICSEALAPVYFRLALILWLMMLKLLVYYSISQLKPSNW